jgi:SAM-dependent methyltransferase
MNYPYIDNPGVNEPFKVGRDESRLLFDVGIAFSCIKKNTLNNKILDFASGTGWIAEWLNRMGLDVVACDISKNTASIQKLRFSLDQRLNMDLISFLLCDGGYLSFKDDSFGNILCFDSLHHMKDYSRTLQEMYRILVPGGRAIFIEPGAKHSTSKETIDFLATYKDQLGEDWIERDVVLEEIYRISQSCGFCQMIIKPFLFPSMVQYSFNEWTEFRNGHPVHTECFFNLLMDLNQNGRVCFYLEK